MAVEEWIRGAERGDQREKAPPVVFGGADRRTPTTDRAPLHGRPWRPDQLQRDGGRERDPAPRGDGEPTLQTQEHKDAPVEAAKVQLGLEAAGRLPSVPERSQLEPRREVGRRHLGTVGGVRLRGRRKRECRPNARAGTPPV